MLWGRERKYTKNPNFWFKRPESSGLVSCSRNQAGGTALGSSETPLASLKHRKPTILVTTRRSSRKLAPLPRCRICRIEESLCPSSLLDHLLCERLDRCWPMKLLCSRITEVYPAR